MTKDAIKQVRGKPLSMEDVRALLASPEIPLSLFLPIIKQLLASMQEVEKLDELLADRDVFIVDNGLWPKFVESVQKGNV